ncbi:photosystem II protein PsbQ [Scytonema hofmannii PCC 7110]|uniref:Photosystem II protein PsbQ n=1 Tax=Scytonema hofmannii PCC 7110 TaxID=128403 RepID=A0A139X1D9_9CYAN|nr:photosystem II protein PsbQ [Scytonema hofmannii]KYC38470.1 photosystem II protein PsbQ [Scytonema hofmannii PCC 7110]
MARYRSILSLVLVLLATFLVSCGGPSVATAPPTYTPSQLEKIQEYVPEVLAVRDRAAELQKLIQTQQWVKVRNFIHGPMAEARLSMNYIASNLLPQDQKSAREKVKNLLDHLVKVDQAAEVANYQQAVINSQTAFTDIENFLKLVPQPSTQAEES